MAGRFSIDSIDVGPDELAVQLPVSGQLLRFIAGPDRPGRPDARAVGASAGGGGEPDRVAGVAPRPRTGRPHR
jgi:hypothetical protein